MEFFIHITDRFSISFYKVVYIEICHTGAVIYTRYYLVGNTDRSCHLKKGNFTLDFLIHFLVKGTI